jgi:hypothetical protein
VVRAVITNFGFTGAAQAISLLATLALAAFMDQRAFANLAVVLSAATFVSLFLTLQIERTYVRIPLESVSAFVASHAVIIVAAAAVITPFALLFPAGPEIMFIAVAIALNQLTSYYSARTGALHRTWLMRCMQAVVLAGGASLIIATGRVGLATWLFGWSWPSSISRFGETCSGSAFLRSGNAQVMR